MRKMVTALAMVAALVGLVGTTAQAAPGIGTVVAKDTLRFDPTAPARPGYVLVTVSGYNATGGAFLTVTRQTSALFSQAQTILGGTRIGAGESFSFSLLVREKKFEEVSLKATLTSYASAGREGSWVDLA